MTETTTTGTPELLRTRELSGWEVVDRAGEKIGAVADLLLDRDGRVRYLDVEHGLPRKHILLPQEQLTWGWGERRLVVSGWEKEQLRALPPYELDRPLDGETLGEMRRAFPWMYDDGAEAWRAPAAETNVVPLSQARDFRLESGAPDLKGWNVFGSDGERLGTVAQLLVDPVALKVRYLDVDVHDDLFRLRDDRHVLVPLEDVDLKERGNDAWLRSLTAAQAARLPGYVGGAVWPAMEEAVRSAFA